MSQTATHTDPVALLSPLDFATAIDQLKQLQPGWQHGRGLAPDAAGLDWFAAAFHDAFPGDLPLPYLYPLTSGGVRAEWSRQPHELTLDLDLAAKTGVWHALNLETHAEQTKLLDLHEAADWAWLVAEVRRSTAPA